MRDLGIPVRLGGGQGPESLMVIKTAPGYTAEGLIRDNIIRDLPDAFLRLLSAATGLERAFSIYAASADQIVIRLEPALVTGQWQFAALLNLVDSSTFVGRMDDEPFITGIEIRSPLTEAASVEELYADLVRVNALSAEVMTELLPPDFDLSGGLGRIWPQDSQDYFFDIQMSPAAPLDPRAQEVARLVLRDFDLSLAGSAFEPEEAPEYWFEESLVPYPVEFEVTAEGVNYRVEFPPSTIATGMLLVRQAFETHGITIRTWAIDIQEGW